MSIIKETIKSNNLDVNLKFTLSSGNGLLGYQQEINNITEATKDELINPVVDSEVRRFTYKPNIGATELLFYFRNQVGVYSNTFITANFTPTEINSSNTRLLNSFFILDYYDTFDNNTQTRIFTNYLTKVLGSYSNSPRYTIFEGISNQFYSWYVPQSYIDKYLTGYTTTVTGYVKFSFYNAKTGTVSLFYNKENEPLLTPEKMYFKTILDLANNTWNFELTTPPAKAYEVPSTSAYVTKVNNTFSKFQNKKQTYPTGNTFQSTDGTYITE